MIYSSICYKVIKLFLLFHKKINNIEKFTEIASDYN